MLVTTSFSGSDRMDNLLTPPLTQMADNQSIWTNTFRIWKSEQIRFQTIREPFVRALTVPRVQQIPGHIGSFGRRAFHQHESSQELDSRLVAGNYLEAVLPAKIEVGLARNVAPRGRQRTAERTAAAGIPMRHAYELFP